jgi:hypothetical protein
MMNAEMEGDSAADEQQVEHAAAAPAEADHAGGRRLSARLSAFKR